MGYYPRQVGEIWQINSKVKLTDVHLGLDCQGACPLHNPSKHCMSKFVLHWREDAGIFERICPHGIGHPDPDTLSHLYSKGVGEGYGVHGCDGCCIGAYSDL